MEAKYLPPEHDRSTNEALLNTVDEKGLRSLRCTDKARGIERRAALYRLMEGYSESNSALYLLWFEELLSREMGARI